MNKIHCLISLLVVGCCAIQSKETKKQFAVSKAKTQLVASQGSSVKAAMDIQNSICIPLKALEQKTKNPLVTELEGIAQDLYKLALKKIAVKYETFVRAFESFEPEASDNKVSYLETWLAMANKRVSKLTEYKTRLEKIQERLDAFNKKIELLKDSDVKGDLVYFAKQLQEKIAVTNEWIAFSTKIFTVKLNELKSRESKFKKAHVPEF
jgi:hypothetical protein